MDGAKNKFFNLNERLIDFAVIVIKVVEGLPSTKAGNHLAGQLIRSGTSPALNYGEAQSGESREDFIHKLKIVLKELRETMNCFKIIQKAKMFSDAEFLKSAVMESDELISIFVKSVSTAQANSAKRGNETSLLAIPCSLFCTLVLNIEQGARNEEQGIKE